jgi:dipeptidyl aminopeptidase/acylaminoacyl peptidase
LRASLLLIAAVALTASPSTGSAQTGTPLVLAPVGRQAGWLNLEAPRPRILTRVEPPDYISDVALNPGSNTAAFVLVHTTPSAAVPSGQILSLDMTALTTALVAGGPDSTESLGAPAWWPDNSRLIFQREDVSGIGTSYAGGATVQYPSRIEQVNVDGSGRTVLVDDAREPAASPNAQAFAFVRRVATGPTLVVHSVTDASEQTIVAAGQFGDIRSVRYSPQGDRIAFMVPVAIYGAPGSGLWMAPMIRLAHGAPWDLWLVNTDAASPPTRLAALGADDGTLSWSPDGSRLFVYGGAGSFIVDAHTREVTPYGFVSGYGAQSWVGT